jgi:hypothetical protein
MLFKNKRKIRSGYPIPLKSTEFDDHPIKMKEKYLKLIVENEEDLLLPDWYDH